MASKLPQCPSASGCLQGFGTTHRCVFAVSHAGECEYDFVHGAREAGALSLDTQLVNYLAKLEAAVSKKSDPA